MKNYPRFLLLSFFCAMAIGAFMIMATQPSPPWQPPIIDATLHGDGTHEDPIGLNAPILYSGTLTQASTSAPTALELYNGIDDSAFTYTRDSIGTYKIEGSDAAFTDSTYQFIATTGSVAVTCLGVRVYRQSDSTLIVKSYKSNGYGVDLAGKLNLVIVGPYQE